MEMDFTIDKLIYKFEQIQEKLEELENEDRAYLLERIGEIREQAEIILEKITDIEVG